MAAILSAYLEGIFVSGTYLLVIEGILVETGKKTFFKIRIGHMECWELGEDESGEQQITQAAGWWRPWDCDPEHWGEWRGALRKGFWFRQ